MTRALDIYASYPAGFDAAGEFHKSTGVTGWDIRTLLRASGLLDRRLSRNVDQHPAELAAENAQIFDARGVFPAESVCDDE